MTDERMGTLTFWVPCDSLLHLLRISLLLFLGSQTGDLMRGEDLWHYTAAKSCEIGPLPDYLQPCH